MGSNIGDFFMPVLNPLLATCLLVNSLFLEEVRELVFVPKVVRLVKTGAREGVLLAGEQTLETVRWTTGRRRSLFRWSRKNKVVRIVLPGDRLCMWLEQGVIVVDHDSLLVQERSVYRQSVNLRDKVNKRHDSSGQRNGGRSP